MQTELVTDASFWIDLRDGDVLFLPFQLDFRWLTTDFVAEEISRHIPDFAESLYTTGLTAMSLEPALVEQLSVLSRTKEAKGLSKADLSCFVLARSLGTKLITSDKVLRGFSEQRDIEVHGTLWVLKLLEADGILASNHKARALNRMREGGSWLPPGECR